MQIGYMLESLTPAWEPTFRLGRLQTSLLIVVVPKLLRGTIGPETEEGYP